MNKLARKLYYQIRDDKIRFAYTTKQESLAMLYLCMKRKDYELKYYKRFGKYKYYDNSSNLGKVLYVRKYNE